jgi:hypothetical protein
MWKRRVVATSVGFLVVLLNALDVSATPITYRLEFTTLAYGGWDEPEVESRVPFPDPTVFTFDPQTNLFADLTLDLPHVFTSLVGLLTPPTPEEPFCLPHLACFDVNEWAPSERRRLFADLLRGGSWSSVGDPNLGDAELHFYPAGNEWFRFFWISTSNDTAYAGGYFTTVRVPEGRAPIAVAAFVWLALIAVRKLQPPRVPTHTSE